MNIESMHIYSPIISTIGPRNVKSTFENQTKTVIPSTITAVENAAQMTALSSETAAQDATR